MKYASHLVIPSTIVLFFAFCSLLNAEVTAQKEGGKVVVEVDGKPFAMYLAKSGAKPCIWPIYGPTGKAMTRQYPLGPVQETEKPDHIHHRSLWFTHGDVNGLDFWAERGKESEGWEEKQGLIEHREFVDVKSGSEAVVIARNDWTDRNGKKILEDETTMTFGADDAAGLRWIDYDITLKATAGDVTFGDTKEGTMGIRIAGTMKPDAKKGGKLINSHGNVDGDAWGKAAPWVAYTGPVEGETLSIVIFNHPSSFRYPNHWHARTYGLCAGNPFGLSDFVGNGQNGAYTLKAGESMTLRYRFLFFTGEADPDKMKAMFEKYAGEEK